ncbi:DnaJ subfamily C member 7 [Cichlidogyrus casuarinus]|uniref:DnaJ subfamily C member 7 n=1 Tax=Cichlidogyrus casuarinus TaxID=1844966 RepID=A0ABD2QGF9_9PLAT
MDMDQAQRCRKEGNVYFNNGNFLAAIKCYSGAIQADPENVLLFINRASAFYRLQDYSKAMKDCNTAIQLNKNCVRSHVIMAKCFAEMGRMEEALAKWKLVVELDPSDVNQNKLKEFRKKIKITNYQILGVEPGASEDEIRKAYRRKAKEHHPDKHQSREDKQREESNFHKINQAYSILSDPMRRQMYDRHLEQSTRSSPNHSRRGSSERRPSRMTSFLNLLPDTIPRSCIPFTRK